MREPPKLLDRIRASGAVYLPYALERKYPKASREWPWQYVTHVLQENGGRGVGVLSTRRRYGTLASESLAARRRASPQRQ